MSGLHQVRSGRGPPLVLLHGWGMNLRVFDGLRALLEPLGTVIAIDLPGHGASPWEDRWGASEQLELLAAAIPRAATLIGWSLGGQWALELAARTAAHRLVLIATTPRFVRAPEWPHALDGETLRRFRASLERDSAATLLEFIELQARGGLGAAEVRAQLRAALERGGSARPAALRCGLDLLERNDLRRRAQATPTPALVICGRHDRVMPDAGPALAALMPCARLLQLPRAGHAPFLSHPEQIAAALSGFLAARADAAV